MDVGQRLDAITEADLRAAGSLKWSRPGPDGYGAFIAEMDFGWFDDVLSYLDRNRMLLADLVAEHLPGVRYRPPDGTYLAWLDFSDLGLSESPGLLMAERAHVFLIDGPACGAAGAGAVRLTFATPAPVLEGMVARMGAGLRAAASSGTP